MSSPQTTSDVTAVADAIRSHDRFLIVTHENPDGDALGSILAMKLALDQLGKDSVMYLYGDAPLPAEYSFMPLAELRRRLPDDWRERVLLALDCANESRIGPEPEPLQGAPLVVDIDHHHDNSRFGAVNLIVPKASSKLRRRFTSRSSRIPAASSTRTRLRRHCAWRPSWSTRAQMSTGSSGGSTRRCSSRS
jgi:hypothetical protein